MRLVSVIATMVGLCVFPTILFAADKEPVTARDFYERGTHRPDSENELSLADLSKAIELDPKLDAAIGSRAGVYAALGKYPQAIDDYTVYLARHPGHYSTLFNRAGCNKAAKRYEEAIVDYNDILDGEIDFKNTITPREHALARSHHYRGDLLFEWTKDYPAAIADYTAALELEPGISEVRMQRATVYRVLGEWSKADADYRQEAELTPKSSNVFSAWAWQYATCPEDRFRNGSRAIELAQQACEKSRWSIPSHLSTLAAAYAESGRFDDAVETQTKAIEQNTLEFWRPIFKKRLESFRQSQPLRHDPRVRKPS